MGAGLTLGSLFDGIGGLQRAAVDREQIKRLKQISNVLSITAGTDTNIKECMESLLEIAKDLERSGTGGKEEKEDNAV